MPVPPVLEALARFRAQIDARDTQALNRLIDNYVSSWQRLELLLNRLLLELGDETPTAGQLIRLTRYKRLMEQAAQELAGLQALTGNEIETAGEIGINLGQQHMQELISTAISGGPEIATAFNALPKDAVETLLGFMDPEGPLFARLRLLAPTTTEAVSAAIVEGVTLGFNPRKIAGLVQDAFGRGLSDALRFVRTAQLWSYREANRAVMVANQNVVDGWIWVAAIGDPNTCMSCIVQHGTVHSVYEPLNDHHNGRCRAAPLVKGFNNPVDEIGTEWFEKQSAAYQRQAMGPGKYDAWKQGKFRLDQLSTEQIDEVYGPMRIEQTLKALTQ